MPCGVAPNGNEVPVVAGPFQNAEGTIDGPVQGVTADPVYLDVRLEAKGEFHSNVAASHYLKLYSHDGDLRVVERYLSCDGQRGTT